MQFGKVSYDTWGSVESIQTLQGEGFSAESLSVDTDPAPYEATKEVIYDGRLLCYEMPVLAMELATIRRDDKTGKTDHPIDGHKDVSDGVAGAVWHAEQAFVGGRRASGQGARQFSLRYISDFRAITKCCGTRSLGTYPSLKMKSRG
jgi:hypothetical protein